MKIQPIEKGVNVNTSQTKRKMKSPRITQISKRNKEINSPNVSIINRAEKTIKEIELKNRMSLKQPPKKEVHRKPIGPPAYLLKAMKRKGNSPTNSLIVPVQNRKSLRLPLPTTKKSSS
ncbi:hypothetical protein QTN25_010754 [Entamoeba marina]